MPQLPRTPEELLERMRQERFGGQYCLRGDCLFWILENGIRIRASFETPCPFGTIRTFWWDGKREIPLTHWHPEAEELYRDLLRIRTGGIFWVTKRKQPLFGRALPRIMEKGVWDGLSGKKRNAYRPLE